MQALSPGPAHLPGRRCVRPPATSPGAAWPLRAAPVAPGALPGHHPSPTRAGGGRLPGGHPFRLSSRLGPGFSNVQLRSLPELSQEGAWARGHGAIPARSLPAQLPARARGRGEDLYLEASRDPGCGRNGAQSPGPASGAGAAASQLLTGLPLGPSSPGGPLGPGGPAAPDGPASPFSPLSPLGPCGKGRHEPRRGAGPRGRVGVGAGPRGLGSFPRSHWLSGATEAATASRGGTGPGLDGGQHGPRGAPSLGFTGGGQLDAKETSAHQRLLGPKDPPAA